jgi:hypothetical protein
MINRFAILSIPDQILAPSVFLGIFLIVFIPYSYNVFLRNRKHEYGILMTLGMSEKEVVRNMILENCVIAVVSLISGLILGTIISFIFYFIIQRVIGINTLSWYFNVNSYKFTAIPYGIIMLITLLSSIFGFMKMKIIDLIKDKFRAEKKRRKSLQGILIAGVVFVCVSVLVMIIGHGTTNMWFVSMGIMFLGLCMIIIHVDTVEQYLAKLVPNYRQGHIMGISFVKYHGKTRSRIGIIAAGLIGFSVFFAGFCAVMYPQLMDYAMSYSPDDLSYSNVFGMNKVEDSEIENLLNQNGVSVKSLKQVDYLRDDAYNILPVSEVNKEFNCDYKISKGKFITVFQYDLNDGLEHETYSPKDLSFNYSGKEVQLQLAGSDIKILFTKNPTFADYTVVVNDADFNEISLESNRKGIIKLYSFDEWKNSKKGIDAVQKYLLEKNHIDEARQKQFYKASSKIDNYINAKQAAEFISFLMLFIICSFCGASNIIIHFKIKAEYEEEERMLSSLYRIGATRKEMLGIIRHKNMYYYMPQVVMGIFIGVFYICTINLVYGYRWAAALGSLLVGVVLVVLQLVVVGRYSRRELLSFDI